MKFDDFLKSCAEDCVNGGSGDWPASAPRPGAVMAAHYRGLAQEHPEGDEWLGVQYICRTCGRLSLSLEDGECAGCLEGAEEKAERVKRSNAEAAKAGHRVTANVLRRLAADSNVSENFRVAVLADAEWHEERGK